MELENKVYVPEADAPQALEHEQPPITSDNMSSNVDPAGEQAAAAQELPPVLVIPRAMFNYIIIAATFLVVGIVVGVVLANSSNATNRTLIEQSVAAAMAAQTDLIAASRAPSLDDPNSRFTVSADDDPYLGPEDAPVVVVEFSDFNCTFCKRFASTTLQPLIEAYGDRVRFTYRDYPILAESSLTASLAAQCVNDEGRDKFWEYHNLLFSHQDGFSRESLITLAGQVGVDIDAFTTCLDEQTHLNEVVNDYREGQMLGIRGTPAFFINGRPISGAQQYQVFASMIEEELEAAQQSTENTSEAS